MQLYVANLPHALRPQSWARLAAFLGKHVPAAEPRLGRLHEMALNAQVLAGDVSAEVIKDLTRALERHVAEDGQYAYMTGIARTNLAVAHRARAAGTDLAQATALAAEEAVRRTARYGATHPVTLVARSEYVRSLLAQADAAADPQLRHRLAGRRCRGLAR